MHECCGAKARGCKGKNAGVEGHMAEVEGKPKKLYKNRKKGQQVAKRDAGTPGTDVAVHPVGNSLHSVSADGLAERVLRNCRRNAMVDGKILAPASDQAGNAQQNAGERSVNG